MQLQEPVLKGLICSFSWPLAPRFPDVRGAVTEVLIAAVKAGDDWIWDSSRPLVAAWSEERALHVVATGRGLDVISERPEDPVPIARTLLEDCLRLVNYTKVSGVECQALWMLASPTLNDASTSLEAHFGRPDLRTILEPFGGKPQRLHFAATYENDVGKTDVEFEPATAEELADQLYSEPELSELPPASVLARVRRDAPREASAEEALDYADRTLASLQRAGEKLLSTLVTA